MADRKRSARSAPVIIFGGILFIAIVGVAVVLLNYSADEVAPRFTPENEEAAE